MKTFENITKLSKYGFPPFTVISVVFGVAIALALVYASYKLRPVQYFPKTNKDVEIVKPWIEKNYCLPLIVVKSNGLGYEAKLESNDVFHYMRIDGINFPPQELRWSSRPWVNLRHQVANNGFDIHDLDMCSVSIGYGMPFKCIYSSVAVKRDGKATIKHGIEDAKQQIFRIGRQNSDVKIGKGFAQPFPATMPVSMHVLPFALNVLICVLLVYASFVSVRLLIFIRRHKLSMCLRCGYLAGDLAICPECGIKNPFAITILRLLLMKK